MSNFVMEDREPISFSAAAPDWRAYFINPDNPSETWTQPLVGWAVERITIVDWDTRDQLPRQRHQISGMLLVGSDVVRAVEFYGFAGFLQPGEPVPEPGEPPPPPKPFAERRARAQARERGWRPNLV
jgi:hypothetical protein